jgi:hypothetical protein
LLGHNPTIPPNLEKARRPEIKKALAAPGILIRYVRRLHLRHLGFANILRHL